MAFRRGTGRSRCLFPAPRGRVGGTISSACVPRRWVFSPDPV